MVLPRGLLVLAAPLGLVFACGAGESTPNPLEGQIEYRGDLPPLTSVTYTPPGSGAVTAEPVFAGWIELLVDATVAKDEVLDTVSSYGGTVIDALPVIGFYTVDVPPGQEASVVTALASQPFVQSALPAGVVTSMALAVADTDFDGVLDGADCSELHGACVAGVASRGGHAVVNVDIEATSLEYAGEVGLLRSSPTHRHLRRIVQTMLDHYRDGERVVINLSQSAGWCAVNGWCVSARKAYLAAFAAALGRVGPALRDNSVVVVAAGNDGVDLTAALEEIAATHPVGFGVMRVVGATEDYSSATPLMNVASQHMVYAPGVDVDVQPLEGFELLVTGTSFAAPEVARVLDEVWQELPELTSAELLEALTRTLALNGSPVVPASRITGRTDEFAAAFLSEARTIARAVQLTVCEWTERPTLDQVTQCSYLDAEATGCDLAGGAPIQLTKGDSGETIISLRRSPVYKELHVTRLGAVISNPVFGIESTGPLPAMVEYGDYSAGSPLEGYAMPSPALSSGERYGIEFASTETVPFAAMAVTVLFGPGHVPADCGAQ